MTHLKGKHALITGGGTGIGLAIAKALAAEGAQVTITGRRADVLEAQAGNGLFALPMDVSDEASVVDGIAAAVEARGPVQICVANAGVAEGRALAGRPADFFDAGWSSPYAEDLDAGNMQKAFQNASTVLSEKERTELGWGIQYAGTTKDYLSERERLTLF